MLFEILLGTLLKVTVLAALSMVALWLLRNASAARRHFVARTAVVGLLLVPLASVVLPDWSGPRLGPWDLTMTVPEPAEPEMETPPSTEAVTPRLVYTSATAYSPEAPGSYQIPKRYATPSKTGWSVPLLSAWAGWLWLVGFLLCVLRLGFGWWRAGHLARTAVAVEDSKIGEMLRETSGRLGIAAPALRESGAVRVPILYGLGRPVMLLPGAARHWTANRLRLVFQHELAHLKRRDPFWLCVERVAQSVYWFHPLVWWIERKSRQDCEKACDDLVLHQGALASDYARQLLCIARGLNPKPLPKGVTLAMARTNQIEERLVAILDPKLRRQAPSPFFSKAVLLAAVCLILPLSTLRVVARQASPQNRKSKVERQYRYTEAKRRDKTPKNTSLETGQDWFGYAYELHNDDRFEEAIEGFQTAAAKGFRTGTSYYNVACGYSMLDNRDQALDYLQRSLDAGFDRYDLFFKDSDLDPLRSDPRFAAFLDSALPAGTKRGPDRLDETLQEFKSLQAEDSKSGSDWAGIGVSLLRLRQFDLAIASLTRAVELQRDHNSTPLYNLACTYSLRGDRVQALDYLDQAVNSGFDNQEKLAFDPDLRAIRNEPLFSEIQDKAYDLSLDRFRTHNKNNESQDWGPAIEFFSNYVKSHPESGRAWFNLGFAQHYSGLHPQAVDSFQQAIRWQYRTSVSLYNAACAYSRSNQIDKAFDYLGKAENAGFNLSGYLEDDEDLDNLRGDPRFEGFVRRAEESHFAKKLERKLKRMKKKLEN